MLLVNTVLTLPHVRYAVARAYVDYIFVIIFSAKIYESYILSISLTYNLRVRTCAERSERGILDWILFLGTKVLLFFARFPIFPIIETPIPYNSAYSIFYLLEKG